MQLNYFLKKENMAIGMGTIIKDVSEENFSKLKQETWVWKHKDLTSFRAKQMKIEHIWIHSSNNFELQEDRKIYHTRGENKEISTQEVLLNYV